MENLVDQKEFITPSVIRKNTSYFFIFFSNNVMNIFITLYFSNNVKYNGFVKCNGFYNLRYNTK